MYTNTNINQEELEKARQYIQSFPPPLGGARVGGLTIGQNVSPLTIGDKPIIQRINDLENRVTSVQLETPEDLRRIYERLDRIEKALGI